MNATLMLVDGFAKIFQRALLGIDISEQAAAKFPCNLQDGNWGPRRSPNGSIIGN